MKMFKDINGNNRCDDATTKRITEAFKSRGVEIEPEIAQISKSGFQPPQLKKV